MNRFKELLVWQKSVKLATLTYGITSTFPSSEKFNLISQINRSAVSIASNIAEGAGRGSKKEFYNFLSIAKASSYELETQLIISKNLGFITDELYNQFLTKIEEVQKMLYSLQKTLKESTRDSRLTTNN